MYIPSDTYKIILEYLPILCVDVLIVHDGKCLLLLRENEPAKGSYWFPGGRVNKNEQLKDAALRKAKEETGLDCEFIKIVSVEESIFTKERSMETELHTVNVCCLLHVQNLSNIRIDHLHSGFKWVDCLDNGLNQAVSNPLLLLGYNYN